MSQPARSPSWLRLVSLSVREEMPLSEKKMIYISNGSSIWLLALGPLFLLLNLLQGHFQLAYVNATSSVLGLTCLLLNWRNFQFVAAVVLSLGACAVFSLSGLMFHNGMEYTLLLGMAGSVFMFDRGKVRIPLSFLNGAAFLTVKILLHRIAISDQLPLHRYTINMLVFLFCFYSMLEIFRTVTGNYQWEIEAKNADLARVASRLDKEHTELMQRTRELKVANQAKEKLFSVVAHDLRGPVGNLKSTMDLLKSGTLQPSDFEAMLGDLKTEVDHAYDCLDTLLLWSARQLSAIQPIFAVVSLSAVSGRCVALLTDTATRKNIALRQSIPAEAQVWADEDQVAAIFRNLLSNALKFTPSGGSVEICAEAEGGFWRVMISDTGVGMSKERVRHLFDPNHAISTPGTENERGLGLGLQICREFAQSNGGVLSLESEEGCGCSFQFTLPLPSGG